MKKSVISIFLCLAISMGAFASGQSETAAADDGIMKVGLTVQDLTNQVWASRALALEEVIEANGGQFTYVGCDSNATTQITQIENLVSSGIDILMVHPADKSSIDSELKQIKSNYPNLKIFVYDEELQNADMCFLANNYDCGYMIGTTAAEWINDKLNGSAEVAVIGWPQIEVLLERENGIKAALKDLAPNAKIVATGAAINNVDGMAITENFLQANPNIKVIASIGGNSAVGANEAVKAAGKLTSDFGIFASDATEGELDAMSKNEAVRSSIMYTGTSEEVAVIIYDWLTQLYNNEPHEKNVYHKFVPVNASNYQKYM